MRQRLHRIPLKLFGLRNKLAHPLARCGSHLPPAQHRDSPRRPSCVRIRYRTQPCMPPGAQKVTLRVAGAPMFPARASVFGPCLALPFIVAGCWLQGTEPCSCRGRVSQQLIFTRLQLRTRFQSFFILMTTHPFAFASSYSACVNVPTLLSGRPWAGP